MPRCDKRHTVELSIPIYSIFLVCDNRIRKLLCVELGVLMECGMHSKEPETNNRGLALPITLWMVMERMKCAECQLESRDGVDVCVSRISYSHSTPKMEECVSLFVECAQTNKQTNSHRGPLECGEGNIPRARCCSTRNLVGDV